MNRITGSRAREVLVVVVGILLAFAIDAGWDALASQRAQSALAAGLKEDLRAADVRLASLIETKRTLAQASLRVIEAGQPGGTPIPTDSLRTFGDRTISWATLDLRHGTLGSVLAGVADFDLRSPAARADLYALGVGLASAEENERRIVDWIRAEIYTLVPDQGGSILERIVAPQFAEDSDLTYLQSPAARNALAARVVLEWEAISDLESLQGRIASLMQAL